MARKDFHHPFEPYEIQQDLMEAIYSCIEDGKVGIFESPTGTGKSLSLICSALTWLREHKRRMFDEALNSIQLEDDDPEWMLEHARLERRQQIMHMRADLEARLETVRKRERRVRERGAHGEPPHKRRKQAEDSLTSGSPEDQFVLDDYDSEDEGRSSKRAESQYSSETTQMMRKLDMLTDGQHKTDGDGDAEDELKIFFCSRTHSQLSQFVGELQRVRLPAGLPPENGDADLHEDLRHLSLGSRKNLCVNSKVLKLGNATAINERCVELQQSSTPADHKCPYLPTKENEDAVLDFRDHALAKIRDIEELASVGSKLGICPYYASRPAIAPAEMVTLPYPLLLQPSAREALGISLKDQVIVIDEAHNLVDAVEGIHSAQITSTQLERAKQCLMVYLQKFRNRLKGSNRAYATQLVRVLDSLLASANIAKGKQDAGGTIEPAALLSGKGADQVNITKLVRYIGESKLARKVDGYHQHVQNAEATTSGRDRKPAAPEVPTLTQVSSFLMSLMNPSKEGQFFWAREADVVTLRYMLLDPSEHFRDVVESARAVILAGGTMSPMEEYKQQLFPYLDDVRTLSCGHLIPPSSLLVRSITSDADGPLDFSFQARSSNPTHSALRIGRTLHALASVVRGGLVVFFPSYTFLDAVLTTWHRQPHPTPHTTLHALKPLFTDTRSASTSAEETFTAYHAAVAADPARGATLLSVLGGKLSEGINFADALGRCACVVGLPFPNLRTPEWGAKLAHHGERGRELAENVCMRAVNQAIGRVVRHQADWASIVLVDARFQREGIRGKLPGWIRRGLPPEGEGEGKVEGVVRDVRGFFEGKCEGEG